MSTATLTRQSVRDEAAALAVLLQDADRFALQAAHLFDPLLRVTVWARDWAQGAWPTAQQWVDAAEDEIERLPLSELPVWELRLVRKARQIRLAVDALAVAR